MRTSALAVAVALMAAAATAPAQWRMFERDFDEDAKPWAEIEAQLPPYPTMRDLMQFEGAAATAHRYYIDAPSLSVGEDGVVRYTLVIRTGGGATNVSFEGMRCETREQKYYALGRSDGKWTRARDPQWRRVELRELNRHHNVLYAEFLCPDRHVRMTTVKQIVDALRRARGVSRGGLVAD
jgi:hypothetical protein